MGKKKGEKVLLMEGKYRRFVSVDGWEYLERKNCDGVVAILGVTDQNEVVLVEQYRPPVGKHVIEFPAGLVNDLAHLPDETMEDAARREFFEETGYEAGKMERLGEGPASCASLADIIVLYRAMGLKKVGLGGGDAMEDIRVHTVPLSGIHAWLKARRAEGFYIDPKIYAGLYILKYHNELF
ncbi:MAG: NUDIX hydrolase [Candidatus Omnitrophota bacterium]